MTTTPDARRIDPTDPQFHVFMNLREIQAGIKSQAPGIRRCTDCREPFITDTSGLSYCPDCRINHQRICGHCATTFTNTPAGDRLCVSCTHQEALF
jgi:methionyl-tRNA synthetase